MVAMLDLFKKSTVDYPVNPRFRAYGKARIDIAKRAANRADWDRMWKRTTYPFPFSWGKTWKHCIEYKVKDFAAEVGFFIDFLGFPVNAFDPDYAMLTSPNGEFFFSVIPAREGQESTSPEAIRLQFMIENIEETASELERRGIVFEQWPAPASLGSPLLIGTFRSPNGIPIELWGLEEDTHDQDMLEDIIENQYSVQDPEHSSQTSGYRIDEDFDSKEEVKFDYLVVNNKKNDGQPVIITAPLFRLNDQDEEEAYEPFEEEEDVDDEELEYSSDDQNLDEDNSDEDDSPEVEYVVDEDY